MTLVLALVLHVSCTLPKGVQAEGEERTATACALLEERPLASASSTTEDREALQRLLDQPEFARARDRNAGTAVVLWARLWAWFNSFLQTDAAATFAHAAPYVVLGLAVVFVALGLLRSRRGQARRRQNAEAQRSLALKLDPPERHLERARALLASAPRESIREGLLALLSSLERRRFAKPERVKTNREVCAELPARGAPEALVREVTTRLDWYDRTFYSLAAVDPAAAGAFIDGVAALAGEAR